jgi:rod shape-determining protein MreD
VKRLAGLFALALVAEAFRVSLLARLPVHPDLLLGIVVLAALDRRPPAAAFTGFCLGIIRDLLYGHPVGYEAVPLALVGWMVGSLGRSVYRESLATHIVVLFGAGVARSLAGFLVLRGGELGGLAPYLFRVTLPDAAATALLVPVLWRWLKTAFAGSRDGGRIVKRMLRKYERKLLVKRS